MQKAISGALALALIFSLTSPCFADFQYSETTKMIGGAASGAMKMAGIFSKEARQAGKGMEATISVKRNKMRREESTGEVTIYDLDARKVIHLDTKHKTYSVVTFDEMRAQMEEARRKAAADRAKHKGKGNDVQQVKIVPKIKVTQGKGSKKLLSYTASEVKTLIEMEMQAQDTSGKTQSGNTWVNADTWTAQVKGYDEVRHFYMRMAKELDWVPGAALGSNVQISPAMVEYQKSVTNLTGMPLQSVVSVGMGAPPSGPPPAAKDEQKDSGGNPIKKGLGGMFGRKKHDDSAQAPAAASGSLMDMETDVTAVSSKPVDTSLFQVPAGFTLEKEHKSK